MRRTVLQPATHSVRRDLVVNDEAAARLLARQGRVADPASPRSVLADPARPDADVERAAAACEARLEAAIAAEARRIAEARFRRRRTDELRGDFDAARGAPEAARAPPPRERGTAWGAWDWEGEARAAAHEAAKPAYYSELKDECRKDAERRRVSDAEYDEATTERSTLFESLGWVQLEEDRAAYTRRLADDVRRDQWAAIQQHRRDLADDRWATLRARARFVGTAASWKPGAPRHDGPGSGQQNPNAPPMQ
ncbi:hypothetical protein M885DRAFT_508298 [Pelagophyceae sp. CCMP2097]|nr:hypothetical protein M885DRAFT_508298 [Pelagophyceae sp. CCMP2097]